MARALRIEYPGAIYHLLNRGDRKEAIFRDAADHRSFLDTLAEACSKTDWQVHAYCLMHNHFHLVIETPNANLVAGMKWFMGTYTSRFNRRHKLFGHLFSGRYKSLIVDGSGNGYLKTVCDYVHLNPVRAHLLTPEQPLRDYPWSSVVEYVRPPSRRPRWLRVDRLFGELGIPRDSAAGREQFESHLETRRAQEDGIDLKEIRRGWCLGEEAFRQELLEQAHSLADENHHASTRQESAEVKARRLISEGLEKLGWEAGDLVIRPKGHRAKVRIAQRLRSETSVTLKWIASNLHMGTWTYVANLLQQSKSAPSTKQRELNLCQ